MDWLAYGGFMMLTLLPAVVGVLLMLWLVKTVSDIARSLRTIADRMDAIADRLEERTPDRF
jgi:hypothetical protein